MAIVDPTTPGELWYDIPSLPGYQVSIEFRVRIFHVKGCKDGRLSDKWKVLTVSLGANGYLYFGARGAGKKNVYLHHVIAELAFGAVSSHKNYIRHLDDNRLNNYASNVARGSPADNREDSRRNGTMLVGSRSHHAKISEDDVREIRRKMREGTRSQATL